MEEKTNTIAVPLIKDLLDDKDIYNSFASGVNVAKKILKKIKNNQDNILMFKDFSNAKKIEIGHSFFQGFFMTLNLENIKIKHIFLVEEFETSFTCECFNFAKNEWLKKQSEPNNNALRKALEDILKN